MLKHGRAGVPMEVMGLMLGEFVDDYTVSRVCSDQLRRIGWDDEGRNGARKE